MSAELSFVLSQYTRVTDGQTDGIAIRKSALHTMQRGKNGGYMSVKQIGYRMSRVMKSVILRQLDGHVCTVLWHAVLLKRAAFKAVM